jgi:hypothetical protein
MRGINLRVSKTLLGILMAAIFPSLWGGEQLAYHEIQTDGSGNIIPWYSPDPGTAYDHCIMSVWEFWKNMKSCPNGVKYYLQHQVWQDPGEDPRGLGGDQFNMALSSWTLLYAYSGDRSIVDNMQLIADYTIAHGFSAPDALWPNLPYPYNTELHSGVYDGDMRAGKGFLQTDKAGTLGAELIVLYKITGEEKYLDTAQKIADTLAAHVKSGDADNPPWPYRVNATTGATQITYTTNWTGTLRLFDGLMSLKRGNRAAYAHAKDLLTAWLKKYPFRNNKWGPFFEDVGGWSDTEINADTMAWYVLEHPDWDPHWRQHAASMLHWTRAMFDNNTWQKYGVTVTNEQTVYPVAANSHTSRHASVELIYAAKTGDTSHRAKAIRALNWATYMVGEKGNNRFPYDDVWLTDGYGDYVRHYLRAMAAAPELAPGFQNHLLESSSIVTAIDYQPLQISYRTFDPGSQELLRVTFEPTAVTAGGKKLMHLSSAAALKTQQGYTYNAPGDVHGVVRIHHLSAPDVAITGKIARPEQSAAEHVVRVEMNTPKEINLGDYVANAPAGTAVMAAGPYHGKIAGTGPKLKYTPEQDFQGTDLLIFRTRNIPQDSSPRQINIQVERTNLAIRADAEPFTTENPWSGAAGMMVFPALNDGNLEASIPAAAPRPEKRQVSVGILWKESQSVRQVVYRQGEVHPDGTGAFAEAPRLQITTDGAHWEDAASVQMRPANYEANDASSKLDFYFTLPAETKCQGVRVTGTVGGRENTSTSFLNVREIEAYSTLVASAGPHLDFGLEDAAVHVGGKAVFAARPASMVDVSYQWQKSTDEGQTWTDIPGANASFLQIYPVEASDDGTLIRCILSNGTPPDAESRGVKLTVLK